MAIEIIHDRFLWDSFLEKSPDKLLFHMWDFLKIMEKHSGSQLLPYGIYEGEKLMCLFPLFYFKKYGIKFLNSQPYGSGIPYNGYLMNLDYYSQKQRQKEIYLQGIVEELNKEIKRISPNIIHIDFGPRVDDIRPFKWNGFDIDINYSYIINLTLPIESIWKLFDRSCTKKIKTVERGYTVFIKESDDIEKFCSIMEDRYLEQNLKFSNFGPEYYYDILKTFPHNLKLYFLYNNDKIISLALTIEFNGQLAFWKGWVNLDKMIYSNEFFTWELIKKAKSEGLKTLDLFGANTKRICIFKSKFNPHIQPYFSISKKDTIGRLSELLYSQFVR
jgi:hypothetical protein